MKRKTRNCLMAVLLLAAVVLLGGCLKRVANEEREESAVFVQDAGEAENPAPEAENAEEMPNTEPEESAEAVESADPVESVEPGKAESAPEQQEPREQTVEENAAESPAVTAPAEEAVPAEQPVAAAPGSEEDAAQASQTELLPVPGLKTADGLIEITVPTRYADVRYRTGEVTWNADDSATYRLTEEEHAQLLAEVHDDIQTELDEMCASPYFPNFDSITANDDCTVFTVVCLTIETSRAEQESLRQIYDLGRRYAAYRGEAAGNIHLDFKPKTGFPFVMRDSEKDTLAN